MDKKITVEQVKKWAMENYDKGGDEIVECWCDEDILNWIRRDGTVKGLLDLVECRNEKQRAATCDSGYNREVELATVYSHKESSSFFQKEAEQDYDRYTSATNGDYGPSCPWKAPGMSIHDFI